MAMRVSNSPPAATPRCRKHHPGMTQLTSHVSVGWIRTPIRRKQHKRKPHKPKPSNPHLTHALHNIIAVAAVVHFYTTPCRTNPHIILMEALMVHQSSQVLLNLASRVLISFHSLSTSINKLMHTLNGNIPSTNMPPIILNLNDRLPPLPQEANPTLSHSNIQPIRLFDLLYPTPPKEHPEHPKPLDAPIPIDLLLRYRPPKTTPSLTASPILPTTARRPLQQRSGRRRTVRVRRNTIINFKTPKPRKQVRFFHPSPPTTPQGTVEIRNSQNSELTPEAISPAPPPSGAPGVVNTTN